MIEIPLSNGPGALKPKRIVIHAMGEYIDGADRDYTAWDYLEKLGISAHRFVTPGGLIIMSRPDHLGAWHCKAKGANYDSLGIEFLVPGLHTYGSFMEAIKADWLSDLAYQAGIEQIREWKQKHQITEIVAHSDLDPGKKFDPGAGFPMKKLLQDVV